MSLLTERWHPLRYHPVQHRLWKSETRFKVVVAGRRSGKTELAKRDLVRKAAGARREDARYFAAAPTREQAKGLYWEDLKLLVPRDMVAKVSETDLSIRLVHGPSITVVGLDKPQRIEGRPWDGGVVDEFADVRRRAWEAHIRPALADRQGWCTFTGVPEGRNHFYRLYKRALDGRSGWEAFHWVSADILPAEEIRSAMEDLDADMFAQEFEASFISFRGRAYRSFNEGEHYAVGLHRRYRPDRPLVFCLDFNVEPGAAVVCQEMMLPNGLRGTAVIGEVHIPYDSDTPSVCRRLVRDWAGHQAPVLVYGDATGAARKTSAVNGSDWQLARQFLSSSFPRVHFMVPRANPAERDRLNAVNSRLKTRSGRVRLMVDPARAPETVMDLEGVRLLEGGSGEINKAKDKDRTHWTDGLGYYVEKRFPVKHLAGGARRVRATVGG